MGDREKHCEKFHLGGLKKLCYFEDLTVEEGNIKTKFKVTEYEILD